jgi:hypothetical protein
MTPHKNLLFYSANTYLSHYINKRFYKGQHYVWCSPVFDPTTLDNFHEWRNIPASSSPHDIYINSRNSTVASGRSLDRHSPFIIQNRAGIKRGARIRLDNKEITEHQYQMIMYLVENAPLSDYRPLLYVIPMSIVNSKVEEVPLEETANPLGVEFRIACLNDDEFDALEFKF